MVALTTFIYANPITAVLVTVAVIIATEVCWT